VKDFDGMVMITLHADIIHLLLYVSHTLRWVWS